MNLVPVAVVLGSAVEQSLYATCRALCMDQDFCSAKMVLIHLIVSLQLS